MSFLPQIIVDDFNTRIFLSGISGVLWVAGFYNNNIEIDDLISRLETYYKILKVKIFFEKYEPI